MKKLLTILFLIAIFASCQKNDTGGDNSTTSGVVIKTNEIKNITATSAVCDVIIIDNNSGMIGRGVCWSENETPTVTDNHVSDGEGEGEFEIILTNLTPHTQYFVRAYAILEDGVKYGNELNFITLDGENLPEVQTVFVDNITQESADCRGKIVNWETAGTTNWGFCWATTPNPTINDNAVQSMIILGGEFGVNLMELSPATTYYVRAYGENASGLAYGNEIEFTTLGSHWYPPIPVNGEIPSSVLPDELANEISQYMNIYQGEYAPVFDGLFVASPYILFYSTIGEQINTVYNDRYIAFFRHGDRVDFFGKQWDDSYNAYYEEAYRNLYIIGSGNNFTIYFITEGYPNGMYAKQSTIFSGTWDAANNAINDFKVVVILLETSGNPNLAPVNTYRVIGDGDGVSEYNPWMDSK